MTIMKFDLNIFCDEFWPALSQLKEVISSHQGPVLLSLTREFSIIEHLPHRDFSSTLSEGRVIERSSALLDLMDCFLRFEYPIVFYSEVVVTGIMSELALASDYFICGNSQVQLKFSRFLGLAPLFVTPLELFARFGEKSLYWYLYEVKMTFHDIVELGLSRGIFHLNWVMQNSFDKRKRDKLTTWQSLKLRLALSSIRKKCLSGNEIDPLMQLSFIDLIDKLGHAQIESFRDYFAQYFYECALSPEYRQGYEQLVHFPQGLLSSILVEDNGFPWNEALLAKMMCARISVFLASNSTSLLNGARQRLRDVNLSCPGEAWVNLVNRSQAMPLDRDNYLGIHFLLGDVR